MVENNGNRWPKEGEIHISPMGLWNHTIFEDGNPSNFAIGLYVVGLEGHMKIEKWIEQGRKTGHYPPFENMIDIRRVARVDNLKLMN